MSRFVHGRPTRRRTLLGAVAAAALALPLAAIGQTFPTKPVTIVVPYPPGGTTDVLARVMQEPLQKLLGQPVLIDNRPGASGTLGARMVARAPADGHTLLFPNNGLVIAPHVTKEAGYAPLTDFAPVSLVSLQPMVLVVNPAMPARNVRELLDYAKANPGKVNYASAGPASFGHLSTLLLARSANANMTHIPYKGQAPTTQAVLTGEVQMLLTTTSSQMAGFIKEGKLRLIGVSSEQPSPLVPGTPPINQTVPGFNAEVWFALFAPAGTPRDTVGRLNEAVGKVLAMPDVRARFEAAGGLAAGSSPEQLAGRVATEYNSWATIVKDANIKPE
ncbi:Bug family tripartite tricarboxylate transporter substrate binding protein [Piscinibacter koreensis]|uniref:Tripartite tricarboxylate transporter substrate binding protein n=1 Tax=Piscinibacter koreensis TaxID=2742824 RepID=A0A7Y6TWH0_9BURK|nr:tripartite tricarboxylate transporter substrate binding protein [Schlegelella koreensis]NUZ06124.1 tripartite tricarboxylate transporter substrate binding protein [Schlegelella koreensis]